MKATPLIKGLLLSFVAFSIVYLVVKEVRRPAPGDEQEAGTGSAIIAYYFHGNARCQTCRKIEAYTARSITGSFTNELATGLLLWNVVNTDEPEHEHFVKDYGLTTRSVVLVHKQDGQQVDWKNLSQIWDLVDDEERFRSYIIDETDGFLAKAKL